MHRRDSFDALNAIAAAVGDAAAVFGGIMLAVWIRFYSGWIPLVHELPPLELYRHGAAVATIIFILTFALLGLYRRPHNGTFGDQIPRITRGVLWGMGLALIMAFAIRTDPPFSRAVAGLSVITILGLLMIERYILFRAEIHLARRQGKRNHITILGTGTNAAILKDALDNDPRLRSHVTAFLTIDDDPPDPRIPAELIRGSIHDLQSHLESGTTNHVILSRFTADRSDLVDIALVCEQSMVALDVVPDLFGILTSRVKIRHVDGVPLLGMGEWPLDHVGNRILKRAEDIAGALIGLVLSAPLIAVFAILIRRSSAGPVFYRQQRCGEGSRPFTLYKLRTMPADAEFVSGPVWAQENDPRPTPLGRFLRKHSLDELPQFWNVLKGDMSLVGPRPERPHFVEHFKTDIASYMWRHSCKPGMTGWAQVSGLRGNTSLEDRIKHDLYYLEHWSLAFDFKILVRTFFARQNAY